MSQGRAQETVAGCLVLYKARSKRGTHPWVVLCELPQAEEAETEAKHHRYVVWYSDRAGKPSTGNYHSTLDGARADFESRSV